MVSIGIQTVFKRYELKYKISADEKERILSAIAPYMALDAYGRVTVRNIYFDTESYRLVRRSIEKPVYKEKLRVRSYAQATHESTVFVELKKKYGGVVYKRRLALSESLAMRWVSGEISCPQNTQIGREIAYFIRYYGPLRPTVFLSYEREAYYERGGGDFRITFDENILCREKDVDLCTAPYGTPILPKDTVLMELKCAGGIPLWMVRVLSREKIYKTPFSKYGTAYEKLIFPAIMAGGANLGGEAIYGCNF